MIKAVTQFKSVINEIETVFHFDSTCPLEIAKQALFDCLKWIGQVEDQNKAATAAKAAEEAEKAACTSCEQTEATKAE